MAIRCSILAWRIPWTEEPGGLQSTGPQRVGHDWGAKRARSGPESHVRPLSCLLHSLSLLVRLLPHPAFRLCVPEGGTMKRWNLAHFTTSEQLQLISGGKKLKPSSRSGLCFKDSQRLSSDELFEAGARPAGGGTRHPVLSVESNPEASRPSTHTVCSLLFLRAFIILDILTIFALFVVSLFWLVHEAWRFAVLFTVLSLALKQCLAQSKHLINNCLMKV